MATRIQLRGDTAANWASVNPILAEREFALETDTNKYKIGDGVTYWTGLTYSSLDVTLTGGTNIAITNDYEISFTGNIPTSMPYDLVVAASDETTALTTGTSKVTFISPATFTLTGITASLTTTGSTDCVVDVNYGGASVLSTELTIPSGEYYSATTSSTSAITQYGTFTVDIDTAGTGAAGLKIIFLGNRTI
jgi:hypothetical protein